MGENESHPLLPDTGASAEVLLGIATISGGLLSLLGYYDDRYIWGILPVRWVLPLGLVIGSAMVVDGVRRLGGVRATIAVLGRWLSGRMRWWLAAGAVALLLGAVVAWEFYDAPQGVYVRGLPDVEVVVEIPGDDGYTHRIEPGSELHFSVERGRHVIGITVGSHRQEHDVVHQGWATKEEVVIDPNRR
jgi:hypothetical protein